MQSRLNFSRSSRPSGRIVTAGDASRPLYPDLLSALHEGQEMGCHPMGLIGDLISVRLDQHHCIGLAFGKQHIETYAARFFLKRGLAVFLADSKEAGHS